MIAIRVAGVAQRHGLCGSERIAFERSAVEQHRTQLQHAVCQLRADQSFCSAVDTRTSHAFEIVSSRTVTVGGVSL